MRAAAGGAATFFSLQEGRPTQLEWLALQAWNVGQLASSAGHLRQAAVLLAVCGELYGAHPAADCVVLLKQKVWCRGVVGGRL